MSNDAKTILCDLCDIFTGTDGGIEFIKLKISLETIFEQADQDDYAAQQLVQHIQRFHHLIKHLAGRTV